MQKNGSACSNVNIDKVKQSGSENSVSSSDIDFNYTEIDFEG